MLCTIISIKAAPFLVQKKKLLQTHRPKSFLPEMCVSSLLPVAHPICFVVVVAL